MKQQMLMLASNSYYERLICGPLGVVRLFSTEQIRYRSCSIRSVIRRLTVKRGSTLIAMVAATMLLVGLPSAFAASVTRDTDDTPRLKDTLRLENVTIPWLFPPPVGLAHPANGGTCEAIPAAVGSINPVNNSSDRVRKVTRKVKADGSQVIVQDDLKTGTAVDSIGHTYHFIYTNRVVFTVSLSLPAIVHVRMTDSFLLQGNGLHLNVSFEWRWDYEAPAGVEVTLEPFADFPVVPFVFATADGVTAAPGVTNWQQLSTRGDPFNCDPL